MYVNFFLLSISPFLLSLPFSSSSLGPGKTFSFFSHIYLYKYIIYILSDSDFFSFASIFFPPVPILIKCNRGTGKRFLMYYFHSRYYFPVLLTVFYDKNCHGFLFSQLYTAPNCLGEIWKPSPLPICSSQLCV